MQFDMVILWITLSIGIKLSLQQQQQNTSSRSVAVIPGDFTIGLFVSVHHQPKSKKADPRDFLKCGEVSLIFSL